MLRFNLCVSILFCACVAGPALFGQSAHKPKIARIQILPSEPIPRGSCTKSYVGYMEKNGRTDLTDKEIGQIVSSNLKDGYVVTLYPKTKRGIFMDIECNAAASFKASPEAP